MALIRILLANIRLAGYPQQKLLATTFELDKPPTTNTVASGFATTTSNGLIFKETSNNDGVVEVVEYN